MALKNWHYGKLVILWAWGIVVVVLISQILNPGKISILSIIFIGVIFGVPIILSVITWIWLSNKQ